MNRILAGMVGLALGTASQAAPVIVTNAQDNGTWTFGGRVGGSTDGKVLRTEVAVSAEYLMANQISWRTDLAFLVRDIQKLDAFDVYVPTNLVLWPMGRNAKIRPYLGPGVNYSYTSEGSKSFGANALAGLQLVGKNRTLAGFEVKYLIPDLTNNRNKPQVSFALTGLVNLTR
ncbi:MAG: hypothetical protein RL318_1192 [Fibrobacterota bacterium]|jgi:hypothetical protein